MSIRPDYKAVIDRYFDAMRAGRDGEAQLLSLFADDATYVEPFTGQSRTHVGKDAIRQCFQSSWENAPPDMGLTVDRVDLDGETVRSEWTCTSPIFPAPMSGVDRYTIKDGLITRLEVHFKAQG